MPLLEMIEYLNNFSAGVQYLCLILILGLSKRAMGIEPT